MSDRTNWNELSEPKRRRPRSGTAAALVRGLFFALAVLLGFLLLELPWNPDVFAIPWPYVQANLLIGLLACAIVFLAGQRTRASLAVYVGLALAAGCANFFIITFKGQPIVPADLFALSTAASVAGGYSLFLTAQLVFCLVVFAAFCAALYFLCPPRPVSRRDFGPNCLAAVLLVALGFMQYGAIDIKSECDVTVDVWDVRGSYATQGTALCFLSRAQELTPAEPEGYSSETLDTILGPFGSADGIFQASAPLEGPHEDADGASNSNTAAALPYDGPNVIAIMNETFSDLSSYPGLEDAAPVTEFFHEVADDSLASGNVFVSAMGGGTCNSEFEFLTGASMGNMGGGVYPYVLYGFKDADSLPRAFGELGYRTRAIHPAEGSNWRRDAVYAQLGFDAFDDIATFKSQPGYDESLFRGLVSDRATYDLALAMLDEADGPQFVFDVTIQNHGGYDPALVPDEQRLALDRDAFRTTEMDEFASCMAASERDLAYLMDQLDQQPDPVVVCFFGDHQPGFANDLFERAYGTAVEGVPLEQVQERFRTPYLIWGNAAARSLGMADPATVAGGTTSLNYLGATLLEACGLPMGEHFGFLQALRQQVPAINMNGYLAPDGQWYWFDQDGGVADALQAYAIVQYGSLFGQRG